MVSKADCERAVANGADWWCMWCVEFRPEDHRDVLLDHDHSWGEPLCDRCDSDMIPASEAYKYD